MSFLFFYTSFFVSNCTFQQFVSSLTPVSQKMLIFLVSIKTHFIICCWFFCIRILMALPELDSAIDSVASGSSAAPDNLHVSLNCAGWQTARGSAWAWCQLCSRRSVFWFTHQAPKGSRWGCNYRGCSRGVVHQSQFSKTPFVVVAAHQLVRTVYLHGNVESPTEEEEHYKVGSHVLTFVENILSPWNHPSIGNSINR